MVRRIRLLLTINQAAIAKVLLHREIEALIGEGLSKVSAPIKRYEELIATLNSTQRFCEVDSETLFLLETVVLKEISWTRIGRGYLSQTGTKHLLSLHEELKFRIAQFRAMIFN